MVIYVLYDNEGRFIRAIGVWCGKYSKGPTLVIKTCTKDSQILIFKF